MQSRCFSIDDLGRGRFRHIIGLKPIQVDVGAGWIDINDDFVDGDVNWPFVVSNAPMLIYVAADGMRRICPTHDPTKYFEIGAPYIKPGSTWQKVNLGSATRTKNKISWQTAQADVNIYHGGTVIKLEIPLKGGWQPPNGQFAFPIGLNGLTRQGTDVYDNGNKVMEFRAPVVYDASNSDDVRPINSQLVKVGNQWYILFTLPSLAGMTSPVIDPTLTLQPDATDGKDTYLDSGQATRNFGITDHFAMSVGATPRVPLIQFNLSAIPSTATCTSATLYLYHNAQGTAAAWTITFYSIAVGNAAWPEGTKNNAVGGAGDCCWSYLDQAVVPTAWAGSAGLSTLNTDYEATILGTISGNRSDAANTEYSGTLLASRVQGWFGAVNTNYGLKGSPSANDINVANTSDYTTDITKRPKLVVEYTLAAGNWGRLLSNELNHIVGGH